MKNPAFVLLGALIALAALLLVVLAVLAGVTKDPALLKLVVEDVQQGLLWIVAMAGPLFALVDKIVQRAAGLPAQPGGDTSPQPPQPTGEAT